MEECNGNMEQFLAHFVTYRYYKPTKEEGVFRIIKANINKSEKRIEKKLFSSQITFY